MKAVFDSNILIDYLSGLQEAKLEIQKHSIKIISIITWMEVLVGAKDTNEEQLIENFLYQFKLIYINELICRKAIEIKKDLKLKLPDALILATAICEDAHLITRNTKNFSSNNDRVKIPYSLGMN